MLELKKLGTIKCPTPGTKCTDADIIKVGRMTLKVCQTCCGHWGCTTRELINLSSQKPIDGSKEVMDKLREKHVAAMDGEGGELQAALALTLYRFEEDVLAAMAGKEGA